jgi:hypothetical protein
MSPDYLLTEFKYAHQVHTYNTRHRDLLRLPLAKTIKYQGSFIGIMVHVLSMHYL